MQERLAGRVATLAYDRTALGLDDAVAQLEELLPEPPYVLVGHSLGAFHARRYAELHPGRVAGIVLVDPSHERQYGRVLWALVRAVTLVQRIAPGWFSRRYARRLESGGPPAEFAGIDRALLREATSPDAVRRLGRTVPATYREAARLGGLGDLPLIVLAAGRPAGGARLQARRRAQLEELRALSSRGELRCVEGAGHMIPLERPDAVADAVLALLS